MPGLGFEHPHVRPNPLQPSAVASSSLRPPNSESAGEWWVAASGLWRVLGNPRAALAPLTAACARPAGAAGRGHRCARS